ncbi:MAG: hypothetical protein U0133_04030 [Gemmatimonadales bacterium]
MSALRVVPLLLLAACAAKPEPAPAADTTAAAPKPADSLVLTTKQGTEVWFTDSRSARDSTGAPCTERVMQIRRDGQRIAVPLLYTGSTPRLVNDSTIEAPIWLNCRPGNVYQVDLKTGRPVRVK